MNRPTPEQPGSGQESVWDYPRPPRLARTNSVVEVVLGGEVVAHTTAAIRILETSHPPTYYLPRSAFVPGSLRTARGGSYCEWKGQASYLDVVGGDVVSTTSPSTPGSSTAAQSTARWSGRSRAGYTAAG